MDKKLILGFLTFSFLAIGGTVALIAKISVPPVQVQTTRETKVTLTETNYDWGDVGINNGKIEKTFEIKNDGSQSLKLYGVKTSCACTTAQFKSPKGDSPIFGMHTKSGYIQEVAPGETIGLSVVFDPLFHGPNGLGAINRTITVNTNDPSQSQLNFTLTANVIK